MEAITSIRIVRKGMQDVPVKSKADIQLPLIDRGSSGDVVKQKRDCGPKLTLSKFRVNKIVQLVENGVNLENVAILMDVSRAILFRWLAAGRDLRQALESSVGSKVDIESAVVALEQAGKDGRQADTLSHIKSPGEKERLWPCVLLHDGVEKAKAWVAERNRPHSKSARQESVVPKGDQEPQVAMPMSFFIKLNTEITNAMIHLEHYPKLDNPLFNQLIHSDLMALSESAKEVAYIARRGMELG